ncbi:uncharacterized mitochondrial protein AtMg00810-like [Aristolochia californica]|uniref:uncharacterized mitochondrial protein AtMg00810-like n=1 Tax=Aristolochia californica TaxID=171875 RepID=UPI0035E1E7D8
MLCFGFNLCSADHYVFVKNTLKGRVLVEVYVDDIVLTNNDADNIKEVKEKIYKEFKIKDLGPLKHFLGIDVFQSKHGIVLSQRKYVLDLLEKTWMMGCQPSDTPMDAITKLCASAGEDVDIGKYQRLVETLIYLTMTKPDISYAVNVSLYSPSSLHRTLEFENLVQVDTKLEFFVSRQVDKMLQFSDPVQMYCDYGFRHPFHVEKMLDGILHFVNLSAEKWMFWKSLIANRRNWLLLLWNWSGSVLQSTKR